MILPTVTIIRGGVPVVINESDLQESDELYSEEAAPKEGTVDWFKQELDKAGVDYDGDAKKADLKALYDDLN